VASDLGSKLLGPEQSAVVERLDALSDRLDVTLSWAEEHGDASLGLSLVASLWNWWLIKGRVAEGRRWVETFLTGSAGTTDTMVFARASLAGAVFCAEQGEYDLARERGQVAADCFADAGDDVGTGDAARVLSIVARYKGELDAAESLLEGALTAYRSASDTRGISTALNNLAALAIDGGDLGRGRELLVESISTKRVLGDRRSLASSLVNLADLSVQDDSPRAAIALLQEARSIAEEIHDARLLAFVEHNFGDAELASGNGRGSIGHYETALHLFEQSEAARDVTLALCSLGRALHATGAQSRAVTMLRRSESIAASLGDAQRVAEARAALAACGEIPKKTPLPGGLTDREADVIGLLAAGLSNRNIAERLVVSVSTVERHVANIYSKLSIHSRVEATRFALRNGLVGTPS
jgi:ATP/maltotriose-dependent transcriptional regulator MalT